MMLICFFGVGIWPQGGDVLIFLNENMETDMFPKGFFKTKDFVFVCECLVGLVFMFAGEISYLRWNCPMIHVTPLKFNI